MERQVKSVKREPSPVQLPQYDAQANIRVSFRMLRRLEVVSAFEQVKVSDLLRSWFTEKFHLYAKNKRFKTWIAAQDKKTQQVWI